ncbi:MAG TPA: TetR/AcrR family transcriptional regulator [Bryobacteraceae bacterium]|jgi:AcrR family transcriptional regulator|nr:TetR/AcrR family transcriptional regulator [Bryobacteraceae bacterium]
MITPKPNKHELRTKETRERLLSAAEEIFVRDGYADADLEEIAKLAGRTKGAIYAQFKSKEDIFLALVEQHVLRYRTQLQEALGRSTSVEQNREAFRQFYLSLSQDHTWNILMLEFKLFAIRHPQAKKRFQRFYAKLVSSDHEERLSALLGPADKGEAALSHSQAVQVLESLLAGLCLEASFDSHLGKDVPMIVAARVFDALLEVPQSQMTPARRRDAASASGMGSNGRH